MTIWRVGASVDKRVLGCLRIWLDDLSEIEQIINDAIVTPRILIDVGDYRADGVESLRQLKADSVNELSMWAWESGADAPRIAVYIRRYECSVEVTDPDLALRGAATEIEKVAARCSRPIVGFLNSRRGQGAIMALIAILAVLSVFLFGVRLTEDFRVEYDFVVVVVILIAVNVVHVGVGLVSRLLDKPIVYLGNRAELPTFWQRKRDDIRIEVAVGLISLALGGVIGYWINTLT